MPTVTQRANMAYPPIEAQFAHANTGFVALGPNGTDVQSIAANKLTVLRDGRGYVKEMPVNFDGAQATGTLADNTCTLVYVNEDGIIGTINAATADDDTYKNFMVLLAVLRSGADFLVCREAHPFNIPSQISRLLHRCVGCVVRNIGGGNITVVGGGAPGDRRIKMVGADYVEDHGITTPIADSAGAALTVGFWFTNGAGKWALSVAQTDFPMQYNNAGVMTALGANKFGVFRVYALKDNGNSSPAAAQYVAVPHTAQFDSLEDAEEAISQGVAQATNELALLEPVQLGYVIIKNVAAATVIQDVMIAKTAMNSDIVGSGNQSLAALTGVDKTGFDGTGVFAATIDNVQEALNVVNRLSGLGETMFFNFLTADPTALGAAPVTTVLRVVLNTELYGGHLENNSAADGDLMERDFSVQSAGTYKLRLNSNKNVNNGIIKLFIDGVQIGAGGGYDAYAAALDPLNIIEVTGLVWTPGKHTLRVKIDGKNGASGGFKFQVSGLSIIRTA